MREQQKKEIETIKERKIIVRLSDKDCYSLMVLIGQYGLSVGELIEGFVDELVNGMTPYGIDERLYEDEWYYRCGFKKIAKPTLLSHLLYLGYDPEEYLDTLDDIETAKEDKKYLEEELKDMRADWNPKKEPNMDEEIELIKKWVKEKEDFVNGN